jgi:hypothetical protein
MTRETRTPESAAPVLVCPQCDRRLTYLKTISGGVAKTPEYWDQLTCERCKASFEYRRRTRRLRRLV